MKPRIPDEEFLKRVVKTQEKMREDGLDLLLCYGNEAEPQFVRYYSDYWPNFETAGVLIPSEGEAALLIGPESGTYAGYNSRIKRIFKILAFRESSEPEYPGAKLDTFVTAINEVSGKANIKRVGIAGYSLLTKVLYDALEKSLQELGAIEICRADELVSKLRANKSENELACMREAYRITQEAMKKVLESIKPGMTENQLKGIAMAEIFAQGGEAEAYPFWILTGNGTNQAIARCRNKVIQEGDFLQIQVAARYEGYASTMGRPVCVGKMSDHQKAMVEAAIDLQKEILAAIKPGVNASVIAELQHSVLAKHGMEDYILYGPCHGTGLMEGEYPWIETTSDFPLEENMTFDTCLYLGDDAHELGLRIEDGFVVTSEGAESLSDYRREVIEIPVA